MMVGCDLIIVNVRYLFFLIIMNLNEWEIYHDSELLAQLVVVIENCF